LKKNHKKTKGKKSFREILQQSIVFCEEIYNCNSQPAQYLKNKINKDNCRKNHKKTERKKKTMQENTVVIYNVS
jgi:hypothetical protein